MRNRGGSAEFRYRAANAPVEQISNTLTGHFSNQTIWYLIVGVGGIIGGGLLFGLGSRK
jgi:Protein of unknown function (DUF3185)